MKDKDQIHDHYAIGERVAIYIYIYIFFER